MKQCIEGAVNDINGAQDRGGQGEARCPPAVASSVSPNMLRSTSTADQQPEQRREEYNRTPMSSVRLSLNGSAQLMHILRSKLAVHRRASASSEVKSSGRRIDGP